MSVWVLLGLWLMISVAAALLLGKLIHFGMGEQDADLE
ncbi:hypothetical protein [Bordetella phage FP1]|uniref:Uncharacterized protein n=1 Tax=Bordetella phage FP1 TaxID=1916125 RepID=A0A2D0W9M0_9CAUD|nr:hypothetical protein HOS31_gp56 [Bordetella phage FP1]APL99355.1 hypothetical protein [Bordetella phage FP1]